MNLLDVNILLYAFRKDSPRHSEYRDWLLSEVGGDSAFGLAEQVLSAVIRISTHPRIFKQPSKLEEAVSFCEALRQRPSCRIIRPTPRHWPLFLKICSQSACKGNLITDAWLAALAIESGCTWITTDRDFARFPKLKWKHPLDHVQVIENPSV